MSDRLRVRNFIERTLESFARLGELEEIIAEAGGVMRRSIEGGGKILFCGNGGSAADSQHMAAELMGRYLIERNPMPAIALTTDTSALTAIGNDYGYDKVFSRQVRAHGRPGDVLVGITTSGNSENVIQAARQAREQGVFVIALTGESGGRLAAEADMLIAVPSGHTPIIQQMHITVGHMLCDLVESG